MEEIVIVAGGKNVRLDGVKRGPKTLTQIGDKSILQHIVSMVGRLPSIS